MNKQYDKNGDIILTQDQKDLCQYANYLYEVVDQLLYLEDTKDMDLHTAVEVYKEASEKIQRITQSSK